MSFVSKASTAEALSKYSEIQLIADDVVFLGKLVAVHWKEFPGGFVQNTEKVDVMLGLFDLVAELLAVIVDADELDEEFLDEKDYSAQDSGSEDFVHDLLPLLETGVFIGSICWIVGHDLGVSD